jgi:hypothetical protein
MHFGKTQVKKQNKKSQISQMLPKSSLASFLKKA